MTRSQWWYRSLALALVGAAAFHLRSSAPDHGETLSGEPPSRPVPPWVRTCEEPAAPGEAAQERLEPSGSVKALDFWGASRAYPNLHLPDEAFGLAVDEAMGLDSMYRGGLDELVDPWEPIGPTNVGGRTLCLALHPSDPDIMFAGSASGGLWKTTAGGVGADAWDIVDLGFSVLGVSTVAIDPVDPDVMYIGTGEAYHYDWTNGGEAIRHARGSYGVGVLKTVDGGANWTKSLDWTYAASKGVWMIEIHPFDRNIVYAATTDGVYKSTDAGGSWTLVHDVIMAMDVRIHPASPDTVFVACGNFGSTGHGIYRTTNGGQDWTKLTSGLPSSWTGKCQLDIAPTSPNIVFASIADYDDGRGLYKSTNTGDSWSKVNSTDYPSYQGWYSHYVLVSPFDEQDLFVGGIEIWRSTDSGSSLSQKSSWQEVHFGTSPPQGPIGGPNYAHADHHFAVWHPTDPNTVFFASDGGVFRSTDFAENFESLIGGYQTCQFYNGFAQSTSSMDLAIGGLQDNFTVIYHGGVPWQRAIGGDGTWCAVHPTNDSTLYGSAQYLSMRRSTNGGSNWSKVSPPEMSGDYTAFVGPYVLCPSSPSRLYAGRSRVYRSDDQGSGWYATNSGQSLVPGSPVLVLAVSDTNANLVYAATAPISDRARVFNSTNGGGSWTDVTNTLPDRYPGDLAVDPSDPQRVFATFMGFGSSHVFKSENGGASWIDIGAGLPDIPTTAVIVDPSSPDVIYVGTDLGAYVSIDGGDHWQPFTVGMPRTMVNDLKILAAHGKIRAATHGNGAYERDLFDGCSGGGIVTNYCQTAPNSVGPGALISHTGTTSIAANDFTVTVTGAVPGKLGLFYYGAEQTEVPFGNGYRCVGPGGIALFRLGPPQAIDAFGYAARLVDFTQPPPGSGPGAIHPGDTWNFQFWYRDPSVGAGMNLSDALEALFCP